MVKKKVSGEKKIYEKTGKYHELIGELKNNDYLVHMKSY